MNDRKSPNNDAQALLSQELADDLTRRPYRLWYTIEVQSTAPNPERTLEVTCAAHSAVAVDIAVTNPTRERIVMDVLIDGVALSGESTVTLHPRQQVIYQVTFAPTVIGEYAGRLEMSCCFQICAVQLSRGILKELPSLLAVFSVIFQHEAVGEFWYDLVLKATTPQPSHLPSIHCEIGK